VLHELGHLVGLAHVQDEHELMYAENIGQLDFGRGDLAGLARVGATACR
jgi:predicted Zn-dependent protease